jgi:hypothetical protein
MKGNNGKIVSMGTGLLRSVSNAEFSTKNYVPCSFKLEKSPVFRISPVLGDFRLIRYLYSKTKIKKVLEFVFSILEKKLFSALLSVWCRRYYFPWS